MVNLQEARKVRGRIAFQISNTNFSEMNFIAIDASSSRKCFWNLGIFVGGQILPLLLSLIILLHFPNTSSENVMKIHRLETKMKKITKEQGDAVGGWSVCMKTSSSTEMAIVM